MSNMISASTTIDSASVRSAPENGFGGRGCMIGMVFGGGWAEEAWATAIWAMSAVRLAMSLASVSSRALVLVCSLAVELADGERGAGGR